LEEARVTRRALLEEETKPVFLTSPHPRHRGAMKRLPGS